LYFLYIIVHNWRLLRFPRYGSHGYEMINVTYAGDTLIAYKVTGDKNVPRGEITFQADLHPFGTKRVGRDPTPVSLGPIKLTEKAAKKWGTNLLPRYSGLGRVAEEDFQNAQWMEGQLIVIGKEYFSFAWVPIEHQIFFGRPSPELALKMLRDGGVSSLKNKAWNEPPTPDDDVSVWKDYATHCFERTEEKMEEDLLGEDFGCIWHGVTEECYFE
jgi:Cyclin D1 binding domain